jgi:hypothetical protein
MIALRDLKLHLKVDPDQTSDDTLIVEMEQAAVAYLQHQTGCYFGPVGEVTEVLSANGWASIWLGAIPLVGDDYQPFALERRSYPAGAWDAVDTADYEVDGGRLYPLTYWTPGRRTLRATYWAGYAEGAEPPDVQQAVRELVAKMYDHRKPIVEGSVAELPYGVRQTIHAHRVMVV